MLFHFFAVVTLLTCLVYKKEGDNDNSRSFVLKRNVCIVSCLFEYYISWNRVDPRVAVQGIGLDPKPHSNPYF